MMTTKRQFTESQGSLTTRGARNYLQKLTKVNAYPYYTRGSLPITNLLQASITMFLYNMNPSQKKDFHHMQWGIIDPKMNEYKKCSLENRCDSCFSCYVTVLVSSLLSPLSKGFSRQEYWNGLPRPPPGELPTPGTEPAYLTLVGGSLPPAPPGKPHNPPYKAQKGKEG